jgi:protein-S-isoprenylcysteine O-methyltransferase Ste14
MSMMCFLGIKKQLQEKLVITGIHEYVRHPIYSGILLMMIGFVLYSNSIQSLIILMTTTLYLPFGIRWEEQKLVKEYGEQYENYKSDTPAIIPKVPSHFFL